MKIIGYRWHAVILTLAFSVATVATPLPGDTIPPLAVQNLYYEPLTIAPTPGIQAHVLFFFSNTCPVARRYMARMSTLATKYHENGVRVIGVNASPADTVLDIAQHALAFDLAFPVVKDADFSVVRTLAVTRTPEIVVLDKKFTLRYRGRIDDQYRLGGIRPAASRHDLTNALDELLAGDTITSPVTRSEGCAVTFPMLPDTPAPPGYNADVRPVLEEHCLACHASDGPAPVALDTYEQVMAHSAEVVRAIESRRMPPWYSAGEESAVPHEGLAPRERHRIANWARMGHAKGDPAAPEKEREKEVHWAPFSHVNSNVKADSPHISQLRFENPARDAIAIGGIALVGKYGPSFAYAEVFIELPDNPENGLRLTGPLLPGRPLRWPPGEGMWIPANALLNVHVHHRVGRATPPSEQYSLLFEPSTLPIGWKIQCTVVSMASAPPKREESLETVDLEEGERLRAVAALSPYRCAISVSALSTAGQRETVLSLPAFDPRWPLTYMVESNNLSVEQAGALESTIAVPAYLDDIPQATGPMPFESQIVNGEVALFIYTATKRESGP